jgi:hypothetical protein
VSYRSESRRLVYKALVRAYAYNNHQPVFARQVQDLGSQMFGSEAPRTNTRGPVRSDWSVFDFTDRVKGFLNTLVKLGHAEEFRDGRFTRYAPHTGSEYALDELG